MRGPTQGISAIALLSACVPDASRVLLDADGASLVAVSLSSGRVAAIDTRGESSASVPEEGELYILRYACPLEVLAMTPGWVRPGARGLPRPKTVQRPNEPPTDAGIWPIDELAEVRIEGVAADPCGPFERRARALVPGTAAHPVRFATRIGLGRALLGTANGRFFTISRDRFEPTALASVSTNTPSLAAFRRPTGEVWLAGYGGKLSASVATATTTLESVRDESPLDDRSHEGHLWLDGSDSGATELFLLSDSSKLARYDGARWETYFDGDPLEDTRGGAFGGVARLGSGEVLAIGPFGNSVAHVAEGQLGYDDSPVASPDALKTLVRDRDRVWLGTALGRVFERREQDWSERFTSGAGARVLTPLGDDLIAGGREGELVRFTKGRSCDAQSVVESDISLAVELGDRSLLVIVEGHDDRDDEAVLVELPRTTDDGCP